jgi:hypothetical protein
MIQDLHIGPRDTDFDIVAYCKAISLETGDPDLGALIANNIAVYYIVDGKNRKQICKYATTLDGQKFLTVPTCGIDNFCGLISIGLDHNYMYYPELSIGKGLKNEYYIWQKIANDFILNIHMTSYYMDPDTNELWHENDANWYCEDKGAKDLMDVYFQVGTYIETGHASSLIPLNEDRSIKEGYMGLFMRQICLNSLPNLLSIPAIGGPAMRKKPVKENT